MENDELLESTGANDDLGSNAKKGHAIMVAMDNPNKDESDVASYPFVPSYIPLLSLPSREKYLRPVRMDLPTVRWMPARLMTPTEQEKNNAEVQRRAATTQQMLELSSSLRALEEQERSILKRAQSRQASVPNERPLHGVHRSDVINGTRPGEINTEVSVVQSLMDNRRTKTAHWNKTLPQDMLLCDCGQEIHKKDMQLHKNTECLERPITCKNLGCKMIFRAKDQSLHERSYCTIIKKRKELISTSQAKRNGTLECPLCHEILPAADLIQHRSFSCSKRMMFCRYAEYGCKAKFLVIDQQQHEDNDCVILRLQAHILKEAEQGSLETTCDWCQGSILRKKLLQHQEEECPFRERSCPNADMGCDEWIAVCNMEKHIKSECKVEIDRRAMAESAKAREVLIPCRECGEIKKIREIKSHMKNDCENRFIKCRNHVHGCTVVLRAKDRHIHEDALTLNRPRPCVFLNGDSSYVSIENPDQEKELSSATWTAEFWVWKMGFEKEILNLHALSLTWTKEYVIQSKEYESIDQEYQDLEVKLEDIKKKLGKKKKEPGQVASIEDDRRTALKFQEISKHRSKLSGIVEGHKRRVEEAIEAAHRYYQKLEENQAVGVADAMKSKATEAIDKYETELKNLKRITADGKEVVGIDFLGDLEVWASTVQMGKKQPIKKKTGKRDEENRKLSKRRSEIEEKLLKLRRTSSTVDQRLLRRYSRELETLTSAMGDGFGGMIGQTGTLARDCLASSQRWSINASVGTKDCVGICHIGYKEIPFKYQLDREVWVHLAFVASGNCVMLYVNGKKMDTQYERVPLPMQRIGGEASSFHGYVQEVRYWSDARQAEDLYKYMSETLPDDSPSLQGYWTFEEGYGQFTADLAKKIPRSPLFGVQWTDYQSCHDKLGDSPTPEYRKKHLCHVALKRMELAAKAHARLVERECSLGCGLVMPSSALESHQAMDCPKRTVVCDVETCHKKYKLDQKSLHVARFCQPRRLRDSLALLHQKSSELIPCELNCGAFLPRKDHVEHVRSKCEQRRVRCENVDCGLAMTAQAMREHKKTCLSVEQQAQLQMVERSRLRQRERAKNIDPNVHRNDDQPSDSLPIFVDPVRSKIARKSRTVDGRSMGGAAVRETQVPRDERKKNQILSSDRWDT